MWINADGSYIVNGCAFCGDAERGHAFSGFCSSFEGSNGYYKAPDDALILARMKANRLLRK